MFVPNDNGRNICCIFHAAGNPTQLRVQPGIECPHLHPAESDLREDAWVRPAIPSPGLREVCGQCTEYDRQGPFLHYWWGECGAREGGREGGREEGSVVIEQGDSVTVPGLYLEYGEVSIMIVAQSSLSTSEECLQLHHLSSPAPPFIFCCVRSISTRCLFLINILTVYGKRSLAIFRMPLTFFAPRIASSCTVATGT